MIPVLIQGLPLHTWRSNQSTEATRSSFKAERFLPVFDIETAKAFRQLINYCFHRGNHNKWFVSCCLTKISAGTANGKSNLRLFPAGMNRGKYLTKKKKKKVRLFREDVAQNSWKPNKSRFHFCRYCAFMTDHAGLILQRCAANLHASTNTYGDLVLAGLLWEAIGGRNDQTQLQLLIWPKMNQDQNVCSFKV